MIKVVIRTNNFKNSDCWLDARKKVSLYDINQYLKYGKINPDITRIEIDPNVFDNACGAYLFKRKKWVGTVLLLPSFLDSLFA